MSRRRREQIASDEAYRAVAEMLWPADGVDWRSFRHIRREPSGPPRVRQIFRHQLHQAVTAKLKADGDVLTNAVGAALGGFSSYEVRRIIDLRATGDDVPQYLKELDRALSGGDDLASILANAVSTTVAFQAKRIADLRIATAIDPFLGPAEANPSQRLEMLNEVRRTLGAIATPPPPLNTPYRGPKRLSRTIELSKNLDLIASPDEPVAEDINGLKLELFEIMRVLSNVVNRDVADHLAQAGPVEGIDDWLNGLLQGPLKPINSTLSEPRYAAAVSRAARLMRETPSQQHNDCLADGASDLQAVLNDIFQGYAATRSEVGVLHAATALLRESDPQITAGEVKTILLNSAALAMT